MRIVQAMGVAALALCCATARAAVQGPVRLGIVAAKEAPLGAGIMQGAELAAAEINASGGIDGRKVELYKYDDHASATDGERAFQRAATKDHVAAVIAGLLSGIRPGKDPCGAGPPAPAVAGRAKHQKPNNVHKRSQPHK